jgi:parallel beta-helix repeat protein
MIWIFGLMLSSLASAQDPSAGDFTWQLKTPMQQSRSHCASVSLNGKVYAIGSYVGGHNGTAAVEEYDPVTDRWTQKASISNAVWGLRAAVVSGKIYVFGGANNPGGNSTHFSTVEEYDPTANRWTLKSPMSQAKYNMAIAVFSDKIYIIGGTRGDISFDTIDVYDPLTDTWTTKTPMPFHRHIQYFAQLGDKVYLFGNPTYVYDMATDTWSQRAAPPFDNVGAPATAAMNGKIYVFGGSYTWGSTGPVGIPDVYEYAPSTDTWSAKMPMATGVALLWQAASVVGNKVYVLGGQTAYPTQSTTLVQEGTLAPAENWQIVYQTDFSSDPGWITSWPDRYVWDPATGTYCFSHIMYTYSYIPIAYDPTLKYKLEFDINLTQCEWGSYFNLGLWDADMLTKEPTHWHVRYHHVDEGNSACIVYWTNDLIGGGDSPIMPFALNTWYHNKAIYDPTSDMFTLEITRKDDGVLLGTYTLAAVGEFLNIERLGISCTQSTYGDRLQAGCIDNVVLYVVPEPKPPLVYYVDAVNGNDNNNGLSRRTAFATIAKGIDLATNRYKVLVYPGVYQEEVDFKGKAITIQGVATKAGIPVIENPGDFAVSIYSGEGPRAILKNFVIRNSFMAIFIAGSSPTIKNLTVVDNKYGIETYAGSEPDISNCIFWNNSDSDLFQCEARYSWVQSDIEPIPGLVAYWSFDEGVGSVAHDSSGNSHDGTIYGATWVNGVSDNALSFDGVDDYIQVPGAPLNLGTSDVTLSAWIRVDDPAPRASAIVTKRHTEIATSAGYGLYTTSDWGSGGSIVADIGDGSGVKAYYYNGSIINDGQWHLITAVSDRDGYGQMYVDGVPDGEPTPIWHRSGSIDNGYDVLIGKTIAYIDVPGYFLGAIDEVRIYDRALSAEVINQLYHNGLDDSPLFADPVNSDYHLLSQRGRYWPRPDVWVLDKVTSPCIDGGDPYDDPADEPMPNGGRIDMGAFGGTPFASMSEIKCLAGDVNHDGIVNMIDLAMLAENWLKGE